jgi:hypothetical protein
MKTKRPCPQCNSWNCFHQYHRESLGLPDPPKDPFTTRVEELEATIQRLAKENVELKETLDKKFI